MIDISLWVAHLRYAPPPADALQHGGVLMHPFVLRQLACGNWKKRREVLRLLGHLPCAPQVTDPEVMEFIERCALMGRGRAGRHRLVPYSHVVVFIKILSNDRCQPLARWRVAQVVLASQDAAKGGRCKSFCQCSTARST